MNIDSEKKRLSHQKLLDDICGKISSTDMLPIYVHDRTEEHDLFIFSTFIPIYKQIDILNKHFWDMSCDGGKPSSCIYGNSETATYLRYGNDEGFEPIVIVRSFNDIKNSYIEIAEEFRLFHNLYHDRITGNFIKIFDDGTEAIVAEERDGNIKIRAKELRQFLAIKEKCLSIQFDCKEYSMASLTQLEQIERSEDDRTDDYTYCIRYGYSDFVTNGSKSFSVITGKRLLKPFAKSKSGMWGFDKSDTQKGYIEFIIGEDDDGEQISYLSNPESLADFLGKKQEAPNYLTPVHFRNEVLDKYRNNPTKYFVEDGLLKCGSLWSMQIDTGAIDKVVVWLGDLGRDLPYEEQLHWRSYNILPSGKPISDTYYKTQLMAEFSDSQHPIAIFKASYGKLIKQSCDILGWSILLQLHDGDQHYFSALKLLTCDEQKEFDEQILALAKILIDSLNEKELRRLLIDPDSVKNGSIIALETVLKQKNIDPSTHIQYLRNLQSLRSTSSAHRKGKNYRELCEKIGLNRKSKSDIFIEILQQGILYIDFLEKNIHSFKVDS